MIYDCFTYFNEKELLYYRLKHLWSWVDKFVIVEADYTHRGVYKGFTLENLLDTELFLWAKDKIIYVKKEIDLPSNLQTYQYQNHYQENSPYWMIENQQRNSIMDGLGETNDDDIIIIGDLDEFPNEVAMNEIIQMTNSFEVFCLGMRCFCHYLNLEQNTWDNIISWKATVYGKRKYLTIPQDWRDNR
jgi:beta-1,4-mannosyl-glycoprotein beta-1,4-N-acetylglucosaminyltransferase